MKKIGYHKTKEMEPRPGVKYATVYYVQSAKQRKDLYNYIYNCMTEIGQMCEEFPELAMELGEPQKGFPKTSGGLRSGYEIMEDIANELKGKKKDGSLKDIAKAPLDRWNKMFPQYEVEMVESQSDVVNAFRDLFK